MARLLLLILLLPLVTQGCDSRPKCGRCKLPTADNFKFNVLEGAIQELVDVDWFTRDDPIILYNLTHATTGCMSLYMQCFRTGDPSMDPPGAEEYKYIANPPSRTTTTRDPRKAPPSTVGPFLDAYFIWTKDDKNVSVHAYYADDRKGFNYQEFTCSENGEWTFQYPSNVKGGVKLPVKGAFCLYTHHSTTEYLFGHHLDEPLTSPFVDLYPF